MPGNMGHHEKQADGTWKWVDPVCATPGCGRAPELLRDYEDGDYYASHCGGCNDRMAEREQERREFAYYHPSDGGED